MGVECCKVRLLNGNHSGSALLNGCSADPEWDAIQQR
jgi:hypothetical protein